MGGGDMAVDTTIRAAIFDYGGVLTTAGRPAIEQWTQRERIRPDSFSAVLKAWLSRDAPRGNPLHQLETGELDIAEFNRALAAQLSTVDGDPVATDGLIQRMFALMHPVAEMHELVRDLATQGVRTVLLSNSWGNAYPRATLAELFEFAVISGELGIRKPDPQIYLHTLHRLGLPARQTVFIDDAQPNTAMAEQLGLHTVLHRAPDSTRDEIARLVADSSPVPSSREKRKTR